jgi:hypothetical protein
MSDRLPITGEYPRPGQDRKEVEHYEGFTLALDHALEQWDETYPSELAVTFEAVIEPNPGGIGTYRAFLGSGS